MLFLVYRGIVSINAERMPYLRWKSRMSGKNTLWNLPKKLRIIKVGHISRFVITSETL
jgi:hypothetical protein